MASDAEVDEVHRLVAAAQRITVLTGAGISTDSGIPDFRGPNGVWTKNPAAEKASTLQHYLANPAVRIGAWENRVDSPVWGTTPNAGHLAVVELERQGKLVALVTQNVDGLHQRAGSDPTLVVEVHGTMHFTMCWACGDRRPMAETLDRVRAGETDPDCLVCREAGEVGILKSDTISFGQSLVPDVIEQAMTAAKQCDVLLVVGSSLQVYPIANMVPVAAAAGATVVIINGEPTKMDHRADIVLLGEIGDLLPRITAPHKTRPAG